MASKVFMKNAIEICDVLHYNFDEVMQMPYAKFYLLNRSLRTYKGETTLEFELPQGDAEAIDMVMNLPDNINELFDEMLDNAETIS